MEHLRAIETHYNGYRFRSRLEARWSIFFDAMGWQYIYEPEGFVLPNGHPYLPDFHLRQYGWWIEIKGQYPTGQEQAIARMCRQAGMQYYLFHGPCGPEEHGALWFEGDTDADMICHDYDHVTFATCRRCEEGVWIRSADAAIAWVPCDDSCFCDKWPLANQRISHAYTQAKSARFEHGEKGGI